MLLKMEQQLVCSKDNDGHKAVPYGAAFYSSYEKLKESMVD